MANADESQQIKAQADADVARVGAWQAMVVDVLALVAITVVAVLKVVPSEVVVALFTTIVAGRMISNARSHGSPPSGGGGAVMGLLAVGYDLIRRVA